jgi:dTDP-4-dehydrorhamnose 3,5-epimerase
LRGIHFQTKPKAESKLVRCIKGSLFDVIVDLRKGSSTYKNWYGHTLTSDNRKMMYVPEGFGHAFLTLEDETEVIYFVSEFYSPEHERALHWDDNQIGIDWPFEPKIISEKDSNNPMFDISIHIV